MKNKLNNLLACSALLALSTTSFAQTEKGDVIVGLNFMIGSSKGTDSFQKTTTFAQSSNLSVGKFIKKDLMLGLAFNNYFGNRKLFPVNGNVKNNELGINVQIRQYLYHKDNLLFFVGGGAGISSSKRVDENTTETSESGSSNASIFAELGLNYFISKKVALESRIITSSTFMDLSGVSNGFSVGLKYFPGNKSYLQTETIDNAYKNWLIGARFESSGNSVKTRPGNENKSSGVHYEINAGKFLGTKRNHLLALGLNLFAYKTGMSPDEYKNNEFMITPFYEYYLKTERLSPFIGLSSSLLLYSPDNNTFDSYQRLSIGLAYFLKDHFLVKANFAALSTSLQNTKDGNNAKWHYSYLNFRLFDASNISLAYRW